MASRISWRSIGNLPYAVVAATSAMGFDLQGEAIRAVVMLGA